MESFTFDDDTEFFFESLKGIVVKFEDGSSTTMDKELRKAFTTAKLEQDAEQSIAPAPATRPPNSNSNPKKNGKSKGKENRKNK
jgi:hypothetical protein